MRGSVLALPLRRAPKPGALRRAEERLAATFVLPAVALLAVMYLAPVLLTLLISFEPPGAVNDLAQALEPQNVRRLTWAHYLRAVGDPIWRKSVATTWSFVAIVLGVGLPAALGAALVLNASFLGRGLMRALLLIPWAIPPVVNGYLWWFMLHGDVGTLNGMLQRMGLIDRYVVWLAGPTLSLLMVSLAVAWRWLPFMSLLLLAGLQTISVELYEAATVDGAGAWQKFQFVTWPGIWPVLIAVGMIQMLWTTKIFDEIWVLTKGGPAYATTVMNLWVYRQGFEFLDFSYGSALGYVLALIVSGVILAYFVLVRRRED